MFDDPESLQYQTIANMKTIRFVLIGVRKQLTWGAGNNDIKMTRLEFLEIPVQ